jgi:hypothetical protein
LNIRRVGEDVEVLAASFCSPESAHFKSDALIAAMEKAAAILVGAQHPDGTLDVGNLSSPPDTAFVVETVGTAMAVLKKVDDRRIDAAREQLRKFLISAGEALATGGVHTPNHRWVVSSGLARINSLFPSAKYVSRIDDWLDEGVFIDSDGQFAERSTGIYSRVVDNAMITMARLLTRPRLLEPVRRNLDMNVYYMHPDGEMETLASRRQDVGMAARVATYYLEYRYLAARDGNPLYAGVSNFIEEKQAQAIYAQRPLINFLEEPLLKRRLPAASSLPTQYARVFSGSGLARIRRDQISATVFGGSDWPLGVASGISSNPTFFTYRKGRAVLESVRFAATFFSEGVFHSEGLAADESGYHLHQRFDVPYYQPLPKARRNARGDYPLTPARDSRFWSKMDFPHRPVSNVQTLDQRITVKEKDGVFELHFNISGHSGVPVAVEFAFRAGGKIEGSTSERAGGGAVFLKDGFGRYRVGDDVIEFGPGQAEHEYLTFSPPSYAAHGATLRPSGNCVYITGYTPFEKVLIVRSA